MLLDRQHTEEYETTVHASLLRSVESMELIHRMHLRQKNHPASDPPRAVVGSGKQMDVPGTVPGGNRGDSRQ